MHTRRCLLSLAPVLTLLACSADATNPTDGSQAATSGSSPIKHVVVIVQENHTFDNYFGAFCKAETGSQPTCHTPAADCCEAAPKSITGRETGTEFMPIDLGDISNVALDRNHDATCEYLEMDCGDTPDSIGTDGADKPDTTCKMDRFIDARLGNIGGTVTGEQGGGANCGSFIDVDPSHLVSGEPVGRATNWAVASPKTVKTYTDYAQQGAIGDNYFQPIVGQSCSNDMFLASAHFEFVNNTWYPETATSDCGTSVLPDKPTRHVIKGRKTIADLVIEHGSSAEGSDAFGYYHAGYDLITKGEKDKHGCPKELPPECPTRLSVYPLSVACQYDPGDNPFRYYEQFGDDGKYVQYLHDYNQLKTDVSAGKLPNVVFIKGTTATDEHPGFGALSDGQAFVKDAVDTLLNSQYADDTLILVTWDEGGGYYDHVSPPVTMDPHGAVNSDGKRTNSDEAGPGSMRLGTRIPIIALGKFARTNYVSHVQMEHSSIVKFLEWNFLGGQTGQLGGREPNVKNIGSLLDPSLHVPDGEKD